MGKRLLALVTALVCLLPAVAFAAVKLDASFTVPEGKSAVHYSFQVPGEEFVLLEYTAPKESGKMVIHAENDNRFVGDIPLYYSDAGGKVILKVKNLENRELGKGEVKLPAAEEYQAPKGQSNAKVKNFVLQETAEGFTYSFEAAGTDYMILHFRNKQETGEMAVYPDENGLYSGEVTLPLTYARTLSTVQIRNGKGTKKAEATVRKGFAAPDAPEKREGPLSGLVVCIDPGHQENGQPFSEPVGPGLPGKKTGTTGMAQGKVTLRKESIVVLEIAFRLRDILMEQGATVIMTRERQDIFHTNLERCQIAEDAGAFIMLRLHCDTRENSKKQGLSLYMPLNSDYAKAVAGKEEYRQMGQIMLDCTKVSAGYALDTSTGTVHQSDQFIGNNWAKMICFLIELGYMSNPEEDYLLSHPVHQQRLAEGMAQGVYEIAVFRGLIEEE